MKKERKVYFYQVHTSHDFNFSDLLLDKTLLSHSLDTNGKTIEAQHIQSIEGGLIVGIFIATKRHGVPPKHKVRTASYSAVDLGEGEGLAFPNIFLYNPTYRVLALEFNQMGAFPVNIIDFMETALSGRLGYPKFHLEIFEVLTSDTYRKIDNFDSVQKVNFKIANPTQIAEDIKAEDGPIKGYADLSKAANATKYIEVTLGSDAVYGGISKSTVKSLMEGLQKIKAKFPGSDKNRIKVEGLSQDPTSPEMLISSTIDLFVNRLRGIFHIDEPPINHDIHFLERKRGIEKVHRQNLKELSEIFKRFGI